MKRILAFIFLLPLAAIGQRTPQAGVEFFGTAAQGGSGGGGATSVTGTANQITASPTTGAVVLTLPSTIILPGNSITFAGGSSLTDNGSGQLTIAAAGTNQNVVLTPSGTGVVSLGKSLFAPATNTASSASASNYGLSLTSTINQTSVANFTDLLVNRTETAVGSGNQYFLDLQVGGSSKFHIDHTGTFVANNGTIGQLTLTNGVAVNAAGSASAPAYTNGTYSTTGMYFGSGPSLYFSTGGTTALTLSSSQNATFAGNIVMTSGKTFQLGNAYSAGTPVANATVTMLDSNGVSVQVCVVHP